MYWQQKVKKKYTYKASLLLLYFFDQATLFFWQCLIKKSLGRPYLDGEGGEQETEI